MACSDTDSSGCSGDTGKSGDGTDSDCDSVSRDDASALGQTSGSDSSSDSSSSSSDASALGQTSSSSNRGDGKDDDNGSTCNSSIAAAAFQAVSHAATASSSGSGSESPSTDGSGTSSCSGNPGRAVDVTAVPIHRTMETEQEHRARHCDSTDQKVCTRCQFTKRRVKLEKACVWHDPLTGQVYSWLVQAAGVEGQQEEWGLGCAVCRWAQIKSAMGRCQTQTLVKLSRHSQSGIHKAALARFLESKRPATVDTAAGGGEEVLGQTSALNSVVDDHRGVGFGHILKVLELFEGQHSLRSFCRSMAATRRMGAALNPGNDSVTVARNLVMLCSGHERYINKVLLDSASVVGIMQDARDANLLVLCRMVLWSMPRELRVPLPSGVRSVLTGKRGPWIAERVLGVAELGSDRSAVATSQATVSVIRRAARDDDSFQAVQHKALFFTADNAADETLAGQLMLRDLPRLTFNMPDSTHSIMLAIKNGCRGDPEVDAVQAIFLTNKKPHPSICNILKHSRRFRSAFSEEQRGDVFTVLSHLGWAPQRMSSRARSMSRAVLKIDPLLTALAREAEGGSKKEAALHNLRMKAPYRRLVIAGLLADLTVEHHKCVRETDVEDPDPAEIAHQLARFESRVRVLFMQGHVWSMQNSYTMQILKFFEKPSVLLVKKSRSCLRGQTRKTGRPFLNRLSGCEQSQAMCWHACERRCPKPHGSTTSAPFSCRARWVHPAQAGPPPRT